MTNHPIVDAQGRGEEPRPSQLPKELSKLAVDLNIKQVFENEDKWNLNGLLAFQRAANFIATSMIFLKSNTLLSRKLSKDDIKPRLLGHFGTCPGLNLAYAHTNALIKRREKEGIDLKSIFVTGPGHGAPAVLASLYLEGSITSFYPEYPINKDGFEAFARCFSFPGGTFPSHVSAHVPGSIHEGGELGYALAVSYGAIMDKPDMIAVCVIGDGESETGPTAASLHAHKFIDPAESGAVLPILHVNGYKISERTIPGTADDLELVSLYSGYGYQVRFVEYGPLASTVEEHVEKDRNVNANLAVSMEWAYEEIRKIQHAARSGKPIDKPRWPLIVMRTPKGYTGPRKIHGTPLEGSFNSHQVPLPKCKSDDDEFAALESWLKSYHPDEIFNIDAEKEDFFEKSALSIIPSKNTLRLGQVKETYDAYQPLNVPNWIDHAKEKGGTYSPMVITGEFLADVVKKNPQTFRIFSPDELESNKLHKVLDVTGRNLQWDPETAHKGGRVIEMLSEHTLQGFLQGYTLTGRTGLFPSYEAFLGIASTMMTQYSKLIKMCRETDWRGDVSSLNYIATSTLWRQEHNGYSHQAPGLISIFQTFPAHLSRIYFPIDANTSLSCVAHCLRSKNYLNLVVGSKQPGPVLMSPEQANRHCIAGASVWDEYSTDGGVDPEVVLVGIGAEVTFEVLAASVLLRNSGVRVRVINVYDLMILAGKKESHPHALDEAAFNSLFTKDKPVLISYHGYALQISSLLFQREHSLNRPRFSINSYEENGTTTTPWLMLWWNNCARFQVADRAIKQVAAYSPQSKASSIAHLEGTNWLHEGRNMEKYANETGADHESLGKLPELN
ncbi:phosphoketolase [Wallemia mellicola]|uniref:Phosphoketolase n=1 Tax=Wallemia mellicola TaxID=1708541 RepID=A0A4T0NXJ7_9BASI|nr:phosphoketolase [Wallemia mellicola]TIC69067.1 phosphoketolase [Wallemia mellicola]